MNDKPRTDCEICQIVGSLPAATIIEESNYWVSNLGIYDQSSLGRCFITLKRHASELDKLTMDEEVDFIRLRNKLLHALRTTFQPLTFNIACLKNDAFKPAPDSISSDAAHVHWHIIPRYTSASISFLGQKFRDPAPGLYLPANRPKQPVELPLAAAITEQIILNYS